MRVLIDAVNVTATGPLAVVRSLIPELLRLPGLECTGLLAEGPLAHLAWPGAVRVIPARVAGWRNRFSRLGDAVWRVPETASAHGADAILTLGDIGALRGSQRSVVFVHNALLLTPTSGVATAAQRAVFARTVQRASRVVVQTPIMADALMRRYAIPIGRIRVVPHPAPHIARTGRVPEAFRAHGEELRLLYLAAYYPHKRHDLLREVARGLRQRGLNGRVTISLTLASTPGTQPLLDSLKEEAPDIIRNLGVLAQEDAAAALACSDGLLHLSDAESYGMTLLEAMKAGRAIIAPDLGYARWACGDAARYFRPGDPESIVDAIASAVRENDRGGAVGATARAAALTQFLPSWSSVARAFEEELHAAMSSRRA